MFQVCSVMPGLVCIKITTNSLQINCYSLNSVGPTVESFSGPRRYLAIYFASSIASNHLYYSYNSQWNSLPPKYSNSIISRKSGAAMSYRFCKMPAVGASGAIFGLVSSFNILFVTSLLNHLPYFTCYMSLEPSFFLKKKKINCTCLSWIPIFVFHTGPLSSLSLFLMSCNGSGWIGCSVCFKAQRPCRRW